jgi:hypothetical protein
MEPMKAVKASRIGRRALLLTGIGVLAAGSVTGVSFALTSSAIAPTAAQTTSTTSASGSATPRVDRPRERALQVLRRAVSGEVEIATKNGFVTIDFNRGTVSSVSGSSITVLRPDGQSVTEAVTGTTHMPKKGAPATGQNVIVISHSGDALYIFDVGPFHAPGSGSKKTTQTQTHTGSTTSSFFNA